MPVAVPEAGRPCRADHQEGTGHGGGPVTAGGAPPKWWR
ncbi:unnamed protein product [[Actinomadura] parvosata subsp. kistnae]|nr:unnamed protein product [Actinomadura parvosata subsp. kistnae]